MTQETNFAKSNNADFVFFWLNIVERRLSKGGITDCDEFDFHDFHADLINFFGDKFWFIKNLSKANPEQKAILFDDDSFLLLIENEKFFEIIDPKQYHFRFSIIKDASYNPEIFKA